MNMRTKTQGDAIIFELTGQLEYESTQAFEDHCAELLAKIPEAKIVFNMENLRFVGSTGINQFIRVMKDFNGRPRKPRLCHLSSEFEKMFRVYQTKRNPFDIHTDEAAALASFDSDPATFPEPKKRKKRVVGKA